jgi:hypothetical protein
MPNIKAEPYIIPQKSFDLSAAISYSDNLKFLPVPAIRQLWRIPAPHNPEIDVK